MLRVSSAMHHGNHGHAARQHHVVDHKRESTERTPADIVDRDRILLRTNTDSSLGVSNAVSTDSINIAMAVSTVACLPQDRLRAPRTGTSALAGRQLVN